MPYGRKARNGITLHDMRHSFAAFLRKAGVAIPVRMQLTGHETDEMDRRYDRVDLEGKARAIQKLEEYLTRNDFLTTKAENGTVH